MRENIQLHCTNLLWIRNVGTVRTMWRMYTSVVHQAWYKRFRYVHECKKDSMLTQKHAMKLTLQRNAIMYNIRPHHTPNQSIARNANKKIGIKTNANTTS